MATSIRRQELSVATRHWQGHPFALAQLLEQKHGKPVRFAVAANNVLPVQGSQYQQESDGNYKITLSTKSLVGKFGVLPEYYQRHYQHMLRQRDYAFAGFIDIFQGRQAYLQYQAWSYTNLLSKRSEARQLLSGIAGLSNASKADLLLRYAGRLTKRPLSSALVSTIVSDYFSMPIKLLGFKGDWLKLARSQCTRLGQANNSQLGQSFMLGQKVRHVANKCEVQVGPLSLTQFNAMLPGGDMAAVLRHILTDLLPSYIRLQVRLVLCSQEIPALHLNNSSRLGFNSWVGQSQRRHDATDVVYQIKGDIS